jgi:(p)ppGpp synthase/HD superfamily hydrolase
MTQIYYERLEDKAEAVAKRAHQFQYRKDFTTPAYMHPMGVVENLKKAGIRNQDILCAGWLHDTVEDCNMTIGYIEREFNPRVAYLVGKLTKTPKMSREEYANVIANSCFDVKIVKLADMAQNCSTLREDYLPRDLIERKVNECRSMYLDMARKLSPRIYEMLLEEIDGINGFSRKDWERF